MDAIRQLAESIQRYPEQGVRRERRVNPASPTRKKCLISGIFFIVKCTLELLRCGA